jgi:SpoVK/Ycf46/Vps4 family AAA+-type ATPase
LLWGPPGTGKTRLARAAAHAAGACLLAVRGPELVTSAVGESEAALRGVFAEARARAPCVVLLDELDAIAPARSGGDGLGRRGDAGDSGGDEGMSARVVAALLGVLDGPDSARSMRGVVVVATTNRPEAIDRALRRPGRFDREIEVGVPSPEARMDIFEKRLVRARHDVSPRDAASLMRSAHGFVGADIASLCANAAMEALRRIVRARDRDAGEPRRAVSADEVAARMEKTLRLDFSGIRRDAVTYGDFVAARRRVKPSALREVAVEFPRVQWDDVGGQADVKQKLREAVEWRERHGDAMLRVGALPPAGTLLYGPPGCSKTMLARAVASASGRNFLTVKGPELHSKYVGESEKAIRQLFARARVSSPSVVFLDELDGLVGMRNSSGESNGGPSSGDRILAQLLTEMDGLASGSGSGSGSEWSATPGDTARASVSVSILAATNRPDLVDPALLRPGRFDRLLYVPPPEKWEDRAEILAANAKKTPLAKDVDLETLAKATAGYTGADLHAYVREACVAALEEDLESQEVSFRHFLIASGRVSASPRPSAEMERSYRDFERRGT